MSKKVIFWDNFIRAAGAKPVSSRGLRGVSGIDHPLLAVGSDEEKQRLIVVSMEHDARGAALAQTDLQVAFPQVKVIVARPVYVSVQSMLSTDFIDRATPSAIEERFRRHDRAIRKMASATLTKDDIHSDWFEKHLAHFRFLFIRSVANFGESLDDELKRALIAGAEEDPIAQDREFGVCAVPLYSLSGKEIAEVGETDKIDQIRQLLQRKNILQYFFPPPDQLSLGVIDRCRPKNRSELIALTESAPAMGHPFGCPEMVPNGSATAVIGKLLERGLALEGEVQMEMSPEGQKVRSTVRFKPQEGLLSKLINRVSVNLSLKDLFGKSSEK